MKEKLMPSKVSMTVLITKENATKLRKLVYGLKSRGESMSISKIIDDSLTATFADTEWYQGMLDIISDE